ncbi:MAG: TIM barrel protein [Anaerolineales bacterium]|nr:TIM barrel protein [Anaerolineales bacterium]
MNCAFRFGTVGSPLSTPAKPGGTVGGIRRAAELGLDCLELAWVRSVRVSEAACESIRREAQLRRAALSVHAPYFINLNADSAEWPKSRMRIMQAARYGRLAGATDIVLHPGSYFGRPPAEVLRTAVPRLRECVLELRAEGNPVILRPETMGKAALLGSLEDVLALSAEIDGVLPCLDFAHLHARNGLGNSFEEWMGMLDKIGAALGKESLGRMHIHLSGIEYGGKGERRHLPIREADLRFRELLEALKTARCSGRILCESPLLEQDALFLRDAWRAEGG